ncbi:XRE family transcriptional regulator [Dehalococcoides mccartyi]|uniref:XRE family transcriptional regulator n=1 Tax=Dehalococcoides mccartyi TaxID=61435 RepID=UPI0007506089|nr:XRE family transcriptional regulator [Dehalococcoides mccartyi]
MNNQDIIRINPKILEWARESSGYSQLDIANRCNITEVQYNCWESEGTEVSLETLRSLSRLFKLQMATFFYPSVPQKPLRPIDRRNGLNRQLSPQTVISFRETFKLRKFLLDLKGKEFYIKKYTWLSGIDKKLTNKLDNQSLTDFVREIIGYSISDQIKDKDTIVSYRNWRKLIEENLGINTFQYSLPEDDVQGYCYSDYAPYCIVTNSKYSHSSRIFTLLHEIGHIIKQQSGLCIPDQVTDKEKLELECNSFAAMVILPDECVIQSFDPIEIFKLAHRFNVSSEVYLRRLKSLELISDEDFFPLLKQIRALVKSSSNFGRATSIQKSISSRGEYLFNNVLEALSKKSISYEYASELLNLKISHLLKI